MSNVLSQDSVQDEQSQTGPGTKKGMEPSVRFDPCENGVLA